MKQPENFFQAAAKICDSMSIGDVIETNIYTDQNWHLQKLRGVFTCCETTFELSKYPYKPVKNMGTIGIGNNVQPMPSKAFEIDFPTDLNKTSLKNINKRNIMKVKSFTNRNLDDIIVLNEMIHILLETEQYAKIRKILNLMLKKRKN